MYAVQTKLILVKIHTYIFKMQINTDRLLLRSECFVAQVILNTGIYLPFKGNFYGLCIMYWLCFVIFSDFQIQFCNISTILFFYFNYFKLHIQTNYLLWINNYLKNYNYSTLIQQIYDIKAEVKINR